MSQLVYGPYQRRFYKVVLHLLVIIVKQVYKGQITTHDSIQIREAHILIDEL